MTRPAPPPHRPDWEDRLEDAGVVRLEQSMGFGPMTANLYLLLGPPVCLIDSGMRTHTAMEELTATLAEYGLHPSDLAHVFLTHAHVDHGGLAPVLARRYQTRVWAHPGEAPRLDGRQYAYMTHELPRMLARQGAGERVRTLFMEAVSRPAEAYRVQAIDGFEPLIPGTRPPAGGLGLEVIHTPGHSKGSVVLYDRARRLLFSGDTLVPVGPPRALISPESADFLSFGGLADLEQSIRTLAGLDVELVLGGHGPVVRPTRLLEKAEEHFARLRRSILEALRPGITTFGLIGDPREDQHPAAWLMQVGETRSTLEVLLREGLTRMEIVDGVERFYPLGGEARRQAV